MKKGILYFLAFFTICFIIPALLTKRTSPTSTAPLEQQNSIQQSQEVNQKKYKYHKYAKIRLLHKKTNRIEKVELDKYLYHVVSSEMPVDFEIEALKAQAIVARTYTIYKITSNNNKHKEADICDDSACCQAWISKKDRLERWKKSEQKGNWDKIVKAVDETAGDIITYNNKPINAFFHSNSARKNRGSS